MKAMRKLAVLGWFAVLAGCTATGEAQRPAVVAAVGKVVDGLAAEAAQRHASDAFRGLPVVVRNAGPGGAEAVVAELLRTRLVERGVPLEVACPAKCLEITLLEFVMEASGQVTPGQLLPVNAGTIPGLAGLPRTPGERDHLLPGLANVLLATFAARDGNRYGSRQQTVAIVAVTRPAQASR
jgi:hypothetical protein